jgi:hypothetical protein
MTILNILFATSDFVAFILAISICQGFPFINIIVYCLRVISTCYYLKNLGIVMTMGILLYGALIAIYLYKKLLLKNSLFFLMNNLFCNIFFPLVGYLWLLFLGSLI